MVDILVHHKSAEMSKSGWFYSRFDCTQMCQQNRTLSVFIFKLNMECEKMLSLKVQSYMIDEILKRY